MFIYRYVRTYLMKLIKVYLEDEEHEELLENKGDLTWKEYLLRRLEE
jgi:hypothetical protein